MPCGTCGKWIPEGHERCPYCRAPVRRPGLLERLFGRLTLARRREKESGTFFWLRGGDERLGPHRSMYRGLTRGPWGKPITPPG